jgi:hypothetical protein
VLSTCSRQKGENTSKCEIMTDQINSIIHHLPHPHRRHFTVPSRPYVVYLKFNPLYCSFTHFCFNQSTVGLMTALLRAYRRFGRMTLATRISIQNFRIVIKAVSTQGALQGRDLLSFSKKVFFGEQSSSDT